MTNGTQNAEETHGKINSLSENVQNLTTKIVEYNDILENKMNKTTHNTPLTDGYETKHIHNRPILSNKSCKNSEIHTAAMSDYLRYGKMDSLQNSSFENKSLTSSDSAFLTDENITSLITQSMQKASPLRKVANVVEISSSSYEIIVDKGDQSAHWITDTGSLEETSTPTVEKITIPLCELAALPRISQRLLDDTMFDLEAWLVDRITDTFAKVENRSFVMGSGGDQPTGFMKPLITDSGASSENALIYVPTGNTDGLAASNAVDSLVALVFSLPSQHRNNAVFTMNSSTAAKICSLKDQNGQSIWLENYSASAPSKLLGYPVIILEDMPDIATNAYPIAFGNFKAGYTIVERPEIRILRDQYSQKPHVLFFVSKRTGGGVVDNTAIQLLKCAVS